MISLAEKLIITWEKQVEAMNLLSQLANPNGSSMPARVHRPVENFEKKEITRDVREELLQSVTMKPKPAAGTDLNRATSHDTRKIADLTKNIFNRG